MVDLARKEYRTKCRFFKDNPLEVTIRWRRAAPNAPTLGFPTAFMNAEWLDEGYDQPQLAQVGEVVPADRPYVFGGELVGLDYQHVCGTPEQFLNGVEYDPDRDVVYDEQGLPLCCNAPIVAVMGVVVGLELEVTGDCGCGGATLATFGVEYTGTATPTCERWYKFPVTAGTTYQFTFGPLGGFVAGNQYWGPDCDTLDQELFFVPPNPPVPYTTIAPADGFGWWAVVSSFGDFPYSIIIEEL